MNHRPRKRFGQNFLRDPHVIRKIIEHVDPQTGECIVEIGPGKGAITSGLLARAGTLDVVELDRDLIPLLERLGAGHNRLRIHNADVLQFDLCRLAESSGRLRVVGNLPYNVSTSILFYLADRLDCIQDIHVMLQKEVAERIAASPGSKAYGRLTVMLQTHLQVTPLFTIAPEAFSPQPKITSSFVCLEPYAQSPFVIHDRNIFSQLVTQAFSQRRKTLRNSLKKLLDAEQIEAAGVDPGLRPEQLEVEAFIRLADIAATCKND